MPQVLLYDERPTPTVHTIDRETTMIEVERPDGTIGQYHRSLFEEAPQGLPAYRLRHVVDAYTPGCPTCREPWDLVRLGEDLGPNLELWQNLMRCPDCGALFAIPALDRNPVERLTPEEARVRFELPDVP